MKGDSSKNENAAQSWINGECAIMETCSVRSMGHELYAEYGQWRCDYLIVTFMQPIKVQPRHQDYYSLLLMVMTDPDAWLQFSLFRLFLRSRSRSVVSHNRSVFFLESEIISQLSKVRWSVFINPMNPPFQKKGNLVDHFSRQWTISVRTDDDRFDSIFFRPVSVRRSQSCIVNVFRFGQLTHSHCLLVEEFAQKQVEIVIVRTFLARGIISRSGSSLMNNRYLSTFVVGLEWRKMRKKVILSRRD